MRANNHLHIIISGPSGVGKSTVIGELLQLNTSWRLSKSITTREPRSQEDYQEYEFVDKAVFEEKIHNNELYEYANVYNNYYGTLNKYLDKSQNTIFNIDIQGAKKFINHQDSLYVLSIFLIPPSINILSERLTKRGTMEHNMPIRIQSAKQELLEACHFDYIIINDNIIDTLNKIQYAYKLKLDNIQYKLMINHLVTK